MGLTLRGPAGGHLAMLLFSALVAGSFSLGARAAPHVDPAVMTALRFGIATGLLLALCRLTTGLPRAAFRAPWRYLLLGGIFAAYFVLMFEGLKTAAPVSAAAVFTLTPAMSALFGWMLLRQRMTGRIALALTLGAVGALWVIFRADLGAFLAFQVGRGEAVYFVGCIAHAVYTPLTRLLNRGEPAAVFVLGVTVGGGLLLVVWAAQGLLATDYAALPPIVWITLAYIAIFASAVTIVLLQHAAQVLPASKVMAYTYLVPSWVLMWEFALARAVPAPLILVGLGMTAGALLLLLRDDGTARPAGPAREADHIRG